MLRRVELAQGHQEAVARILVESRLVGVSGGFASLGFAISPDGAFIAARSDAGPVLYPVAGGEPQVVKDAQASDRPLRFSADGQYLYVRSAQRGQAGRPPARIFRVDVAKGRRELWKDRSRGHLEPRHPHLPRHRARGWLVRVHVF